MEQAVELARATEALLTLAGIGRTDQRYASAYRAFDRAVDAMAAYETDQAARDAAVAARDVAEAAAQTATAQAENCRQHATSAADARGECERLYPLTVGEADRAASAAARAEAAAPAE